MRLVDGDQRRVSLREHLGKTRDAQTLRRDEEEVEIALQIVETHLTRFRSIAARVDALGTEALILQLRDLVLHECNQRAHDQGRTRPRDSRELVSLLLIYNRSVSWRISATHSR